jgi:gluconate 5-dehydrogenase
MHVRDLFDLTGKVAIVTGGATGIGRQLGEAMAELGADVVLCARKAERCEEVAAELSSTLGVRALGLRCDVASPDEVNAVVARTREQLGRIDILFNNAGTTWGQPATEVSLEAWQKVIGVNLTGMFLCSQAVGRVLIEQGEGGKIVNIGSIASFIGARADVMDAIPYAASKGGVITLTRDLAVKWAPHRINVNAIAPGWFPSEMAEAHFRKGGIRERLLALIPAGRFGGPDDVKGAAAFLASAASDFVTGHTLVVDGGQIVS